MNLFRNNMIPKVPIDLAKKENGKFQFPSNANFPEVYGIQCQWNKIKGKFLNIFVLLLLLTTSCNKDKNICHLTGKLENAPETTTLYLADWTTKTLFDSIQITNGLIDYNFPITHPRYFLLHNKRNQYPFRDRKFIWLEPSNILLNGNFEFLEKLKIEGSASQSEFESYNLLIEKFTKQINELEEQIHFKKNKEKREDSLKINSLKKNLSNDISEFLLNHPNSYVTLSSLHSECYLAFRHLNKYQIQTVYDGLSDNLQTTEQGIEIKNYIELPEPPKVGDIAPEIIQMTPTGDTVKLSDFRGNYVLLDFWASECGPCRAQHKWLKNIYNKFNKYGFKILSVSGDNDKSRWKNAIIQDSIPWANVSDLKGWKNEAFLLYDIKLIPQNYLINPEGKIIKWRLCNESYADYELGIIYAK